MCPVIDRVGNMKICPRIISVLHFSLYKYFEDIPVHKGESFWSYTCTKGRVKVKLQNVVKSYLRKIYHNPIEEVLIGEFTQCLECLRLVLFFRKEVEALPFYGLC